MWGGRGEAVADMSVSVTCVDRAEAGRPIPLMQEEGLKLRGIEGMYAEAVGCIGRGRPS